MLKLKPEINYYIFWLYVTFRHILMLFQNVLLSWFKLLSLFSEYPSNKVGSNCFARLISYFENNPNHEVYEVSLTIFQSYKKF